MVLNHDCFRAMLLYIETHCVFEDTKRGRAMHEVTFVELCRAEELNNYSSEDKYYIVSMLFEGGFVHGFVIPKGRYHNFDIANIDGLTMKGHEMADNIHNETIWNNTKSKLKGAGRISLSIFSQIVGETAAAYSKKMMNLE